jgi:hypothetical protein
MEPVVFRYRSRDLRSQDICLIRRTVAQFYRKGRSHISRALCEAWGWVQPNGKFKEYAARDLLLRLEEKGFIELPPRLRPKNNLKRNTFAQTPLFCNSPLEDTLSQYGEPSLRLVTPERELSLGLLGSPLSLPGTAQTGGRAFKISGFSQRPGCRLPGLGQCCF